MVTPQLPLFMTSASHPATVLPIQVLPSWISASPGPSPLGHFHLPNLRYCLPRGTPPFLPISSFKKQDANDQMSTVIPDFSSCRSSSSFSPLAAIYSSTPPCTPSSTHPQPHHPVITPSTYSAFIEHHLCTNSEDKQGLALAFGKRPAYRQGQGRNPLG